MSESNIHNVLSCLMGDLSESALAKAVNVPKATINRLLSGRTPDPRAGTLIPIAKYFNISIDQLLGLEPLVPDGPLKVTTGNQQLMTLPFVPPEKIFNYIKGEFEPTKKIPIYPIGNSVSSSCCFITKINTNSLEPLISDKSYVIINRDKDNLQSNKAISAVNKLNFSVIFRIYNLVNETEILSSPNPNYELIAINTDIDIVGTIVECIQKFNI